MGPTSIPRRSEEEDETVGGGGWRYLARDEDVRREERAEREGGHLVGLLERHLVEEREESLERDVLVARHQLQEQLDGLQLLLLRRHVCNDGGRGG